MGIPVFPESNPITNGKTSADLTDIKTDTERERKSSMPSQRQYRPVGAAFAIAPTVSVVIPVKNEARNLPIVFRTVPAWVNEVILVDGRSVDGTPAVARQCRPDVKIVHQTGRGKGDALLAGFAACTSDIIVMIDGDGSTDGGEIARFVAALVAGADYAKGSRFANSGGSDDINLPRRLGNRVLCGMVNLAFGTRYTDLCYGYNAFWAGAFACPGSQLHRVRDRDHDEYPRGQAGLRIQEIPSHEFRRVHGVSNLHVWVDGWRILKVITAEAFRYRIHRRRSRKHAVGPEVAEVERPVPAVAVAADVSKD